MFAKEGYGIIVGSIVLGCLLIMLSFFVAPFLGMLLWVLALLVVSFTLYFFRDPERTPPPEAASGNVLLAPADGKVVLVEEVYDPHYIQGQAMQVSIFLSPLNVHVNRVPANGTIEYVKYVPGEYLVAWHPKASEKNERSMIGLRHPTGIPVFFKQIAGFIARRVVYHVQVGDKVKAGDRFGIVKFGSRMDILVPLSTKIVVQVNDRVWAGRTILGRISTRGPVLEPDPVTLEAVEV